MKKLFASAAALVVTAPLALAGAEPDSLTSSCQVAGEDTEFTLSLNPETDELTLRGVLITPGSDFRYELKATDHFNDARSAHMELTLKAPPFSLAVISTLEVHESFERPADKSTLYVHINKDYTWGASRMICAIPGPQ